jgi:hypothetical protein
MVLVLSVALLTSGCATRQSAVCSHEDPNVLAETIARRGLGERDGSCEEPATTWETEMSPLAAKCLHATGVVCGTCLIFTALLGLACLASAGGYHGPWIGVNPSPP